MKQKLPSDSRLCSSAKSVLWEPLDCDSQMYDRSKISLLGLLAKITCLVGISPNPWTGQV